MNAIQVKQIAHESFEVSFENLLLKSKPCIIRGRQIECIVKYPEVHTIVSNSDERFKPLFIALYNFRH